MTCQVLYVLDPQGLSDFIPAPLCLSLLAAATLASLLVFKHTCLFLAQSLKPPVLSGRVLSQMSVWHDSPDNPV